MKNTKYLLRLLPIFVIAICIGCKENNKTKHQTPEQEQSEEKPQLVEAPKNIITLQEADAIYTNYSKHRIPMITTYETQERAPEEAFEPARFVDFDYDMIKNYIAYVDQEAKNAGVKKVTKLRMYFANYPNEKTFKDGKKVIHPRQNSLFILPTLEQNGENYSFYIGDDGKAKLIIDWKDSALEKGMGTVLEQSQTARAGIVPNFFSNATSYNSKSLILNRSGSGPPPKTEF
ncbi:hypothetical protein ACFQZJ_05065 [Maribacter chungangensis]|uniref:Lipoprotein n=1 Tax=Maribacter chungangensis TaxID=1069117 RepID=A0ABW3B2F2_9FLAO